MKRTTYYSRTPEKDRAKWLFDVVSMKAPELDDIPIKNYLYNIYCNSRLNLHNGPRSIWHRAEGPSYVSMEGEPIAWWYFGYIHRPNGPCGIQEIRNKKAFKKVWAIHGVRISDVYEEIL